MGRNTERSGIYQLQYSCGDICVGETGRTEPWKLGEARTQVRGILSNNKVSGSCMQYTGTHISHITITYCSEKSSIRLRKIKEALHS